MRRRLNAASNFLIAFNYHDQRKVQLLNDRLENLIVPPDESVTQGGLWIIDFFPPSFYSALADGLARNGWDRARHSFHEETSAERITKARRSQGFSWSRIGTVVRPDSSYFVIDAKRESLPAEFELIHVHAVQVGSSLTAITAEFKLSPFGQQALNDVWKSTHEPRLRWNGLRTPSTQSRRSAGISATQAERRRIHDVGRSWLSERFRGFFAQTVEGQPVIDFDLFSVHEPSAPQERMDPDIGEALRALGLEGHYSRQFTSPQLPGTALIPGDSPLRGEDKLLNCWGVAAHKETFARLNDRDHYGPRPFSVSTLASIVDEPIRALLLRLAVCKYTELVSASFADARDTARVKHRSFKPRELDRLKDELLSNSLDLPVVARDTASLWSDLWRSWDWIDVNVVTTRQRAGGKPVVEETDYMEFLGEIRKSAFDRLIDEDAAYRSVLAKVSSLGSTAASARLSRGALAVSCTSLAISGSAFVAVNGDAVWNKLAGWLT